MNISFDIEKNNAIKLPLPKRLLGNQTQSKLSILDVKIIKPPTEIAENVTFESLLLKTVSRSNPLVTRKKRVTNSKAQVMTYTCVLDRLKKEKEEKENKGKRKDNEKADLNKNKMKGLKLHHESTINKENDSPKGKKQIRQRKSQQRRKKIKELTSDSNSSGSYKSVSGSEDEENSETFFANILANCQQEENHLPHENVITLEETKLFNVKKFKI